MQRDAMRWGVARRVFQTNHKNEQNTMARTAADDKNKKKKKTFPQTKEEGDELRSLPSLNPSAAVEI